MLTYLLIAAISIVLAFVLSKIVHLLHTIFIAPLNRNKIVKEGTYKTVSAKIVSEKATQDEDGLYRLTAKYEINGKTYYTSVNSMWDRDVTINMYYLNDPKYAVDNINKLGILEGTKKIFIILAIVLFGLIVVFWKIN